MAAQVGIAPTPSRLTGGWTTVIRLSRKLVSAAGLAPAVTRSQAEHVAATPRAVAPAKGWRRGLGSCGDGDRVPWKHLLHRRFGGPEGTCSRQRLHPMREAQWPCASALPADNGLLR